MQGDSLSWQCARNGSTFPRLPANGSTRRFANTEQRPSRVHAAPSGTICTPLLSDREPATVPDKRSLCTIGWLGLAWLGSPFYHTVSWDTAGLGGASPAQGAFMAGVTARHVPSTQDFERTVRRRVQWTCPVSSGPSPSSRLLRRGSRHPWSTSVA
jgi:hypothetical protein